jgi:hypothetical protein
MFDCLREGAPMSTCVILSALFQSTDDGLTATEVLEALPQDPASIVVLLLLFLSVVAVMWLGRPRSGGP